MKALLFLILVLLYTGCSQKSNETSALIEEPDSIVVPEAFTESSAPRKDTSTRAIKNWLVFKYDEARMYLYGLDVKSEENRRNPSIIIDGRLNETVINKSGLVLTNDQIVHVNDILSGKYYSEDDGLRAACFLPHHGIVFYKSQKPVAYLSICIMCNGMESYPEKGFFDADEFGKIIEEAGFPIFKNPMDATEYYEKKKFFNEEFYR